MTTIAESDDVSILDRALSVINGYDALSRAVDEITAHVHTLKPPKVDPSEQVIAEVRASVLAATAYPTVSARDSRRSNATTNNAGWKPPCWAAVSARPRTGSSGRC